MTQTHIVHQNHKAMKFTQEKKFKLKDLSALGWDFLPDFSEYNSSKSGHDALIKEHGDDIVTLYIYNYGNGDIRVSYELEGWEENFPSGDDEQSLTDIAQLETAGKLIS